jgi:hypothetical protein
VVLQFQGDLSAVEAAGFKTRSFAGDVATGEIELARLSDLEALDMVVRMEVSRVLGRELDLAVPESRVDRPPMPPILFVAREQSAGDRRSYQGSLRNASEDPAFGGSCPAVSHMSCLNGHLPGLDHPSSRAEGGARLHGVG